MDHKGHSNSNNLFAQLDIKSYQKINRSWLIVETFILMAVIFLFNILAFDIGLFGFISSPADTNSFIPLVVPSFKQIMLWLNVWWGLALFLNLINLKLGRWYTLTRLTDIGLGLLGIGVLSAILLQGPKVALEPLWAAEQLANGANLAAIEQKLLPIINVSLLIALFVALISLIGASLRKLLYLIRSWHLRGKDTDLLFQISLALAALFFIFAPLATVKASANIVELSIPMILIVGLILYKSLTPKVHKEEI